MRKPGVSFKKTAGKYVTFQLFEEEYGLKILKVKEEIYGNVEIHRLSFAPDYVKGYIRLNGKKTLLIDLRLHLNLPETTYTHTTGIIVVKISTGNKKLRIGCIVDSILEVISVFEGNSEEIPESCAGINPEFIIGKTKSNGKVITLLDIDKILSSREIIKIAEDVFKKI